MYSQLIETLLSFTKGEFKRIKGTGVVLKQIKPYAYIKYMNPNSFLNKIFKGNSELSSNRDDLLKFLKEYDVKNFPFIKYNTDYIGFKNGIYNIVTCEFIDIENIYDDSITVKKYIDKNFTYSKETPLLDKVLDCQFSQEIRDFMYACLGRMFKIRDNFRFFVFLYGTPGSGKTIIIDTLSACFADVARIPKRFDTVYGYNNLYQKDIVVCDNLMDELPVPEDALKVIVSNSMFSIAIKEGEPIQLSRWENAWILSGNNISKSKKILRKSMGFNFEKNVCNKDPALLNSIIETELPQFIYKCTTAYKGLLEKKDKSIWDICPQYFMNQKL